MVSIEQALEILEDISDNILKAKVNYKKAPKTRITKGFLETRLQCLEEYWNSYRDAHKNLVKSTGKEQRKSLKYFKDELYSQCEEIYLDLKAEITDSLQVITTQKTVLSTQDGGNNTEVKLPTINLPAFSGAYEEWQSFEDTFTALIHNNKTLNNVQKLHYLKSCLGGEAKNSIKHIQVTESNYEQAWITLRNRYSHKRLIVNAILKRLFSFKKVNTQSSGQLKLLIDSTNECLNSLNSMNIPTSTWDPVIIYIIVQKLDSDTHKEWENYVSRDYQNELPTFRNLITFLENRIQTIELTNQSATYIQKTPKERTFHITAATTLTKVNCKLCNSQHLLCHCKEFVKLDTEKRNEVVKNNKLCFNCLSSGHSVFQCRKGSSCKICGKRHHSLLHYGKKIEEFQDIEKMKPTPGTSLHVKNEVEDNIPEEFTASHLAQQRRNVLLATALVPIRGENGQQTLLRALIDSGSQASFISENAAQLLKLKKSPIRGTVTGVGSTTTSIRYVVHFEILSRFDEQFSLPIRAYVLQSNITTNLPSKTIEIKKWSHLEGLSLADPQYFKPNKVDLLLGIDIYTEIVKSNIIKGSPGTPSAQDTRLGWILFGNISSNPADDKHLLVMHHKVDIDMDNLLKNLWVIDDNPKRNFTLAEQTCENIYKSSYSRNIEGRYTVKLPFKSSPQQIGQTRNIALKRLEQLERKLENKTNLKNDYIKAMDEYINLNHMEKVPKAELHNFAIYLPHHAVVRNSETTKIRIVFDASCKSSNNISLNDLLLVGPQLQEDLRSLIMRWRMKPIAYVADIKKMYNMILVTKEDTDYQRVLWRKNPTEEVEEYRMLRVTFGTTSAPYLAIKTLKQLSQDEGDKFPKAARILREEFYVDDCINGHFTIEDAVECSQQLQELLARGGFTLQKWASNSQEFLEHIPQTLRSTSVETGITDKSIIKALGLTWNITSDFFQYQITLPPKTTQSTKRTILADIQRLYDPLGWISPAIITAKILIQKIWMERLEWDEYIGDKNEEEWIKIRNSVNNIHKVKLQRWINLDRKDGDISLHGFCDASNKGYCAVVYYRVENQFGQIKTGIIASKTKVAPVKKVTLPRLELCGALLLAKLMTQVKEAMRLKNNQIYAWTDSTIVLAWLSGDPNKWKPFVSNRVIEILDNISCQQWYHVKSEHNPADIGSRGTYLETLIYNELWWEGPKWLNQTKIDLILPKITDTEEEMRNINVNVKIQSKNIIKIEEFETLQELLKTIVYCLRFLNYTKTKNNTSSEITTAEIENALMKCIKITQKEEFTLEIEKLSSNRNILQNSRIKNLNPYLDEQKILRVGGRLRHANISNEQKHPIILGTNNYLANLIVKEAHSKTLHGGIQLMLSYIKSKYWILRVKNIIKKYIHNCIICARQKAKSRIQLMGDLPKVRLTPARPFLHSGVDFAGPLQILTFKGRGAKCTKAYIAIFVCMATKAIHLELVGNLTAEAFIAAFQRFVSRRGRCTQIWSDQGRNFVSANKELTAAWKEANLELPDHIANILATDGTQWNFIPAYSPNFGGLWEAGVKSTKYHLRRILNTNLTYEEMLTTLCQIEACLNSRPLIPIDITDTEFEILTPGHFLIGEAPVTIPNPNIQHMNVNRLSRWQLTQRLVSNFWHRWQTEYLTRLQSRPKWLKKQREFEIGDIVLLKDNQLPPGKWSIGRIVAKHPGDDNLTRVYSVKCSSGIVKRTISRICILPIEKD